MRAAWIGPEVDDTVARQYYFIREGVLAARVGNGLDARVAPWRAPNLRRTENRRMGSSIQVVNYICVVKACSRLGKGRRARSHVARVAERA